jgi:hypothetical protein
MSYVERRRFLWILFLAGIALAAAVANSTTLARMSFDELAQKSLAVGRLRCQNSKSYWDGGELWTGTSFEVVERNKGLLGASVTVRVLGGRADGFTSRVDGVPAFRTGEEVYLFLWGKPGESYRVLGWSQGTFRIIRDARTRLRVLYPDASDTVHVGAIRGHILNDNPLSLPASPPGVTGVFGSHVVAVDAASGAIVGATVGGWSCSDPGPAQFDGSYAIERLPIGSSYLIYAEPLNGAVDPSEISNATASLCRNSTSDPGWPSLQGCVAPPVSFTVRTQPGP